MIESTDTLAQGIDKAPKYRYTPASWLRCPNKSCIWERSSGTAAEMCFMYIRARVAGPDARDAMERELADASSVSSADRGSYADPHKTPW